MKYAGWNARHEKYENDWKHWEYDDADIHVSIKDSAPYIDEEYYDVIAYGDDIQSVITSVMNSGFEVISRDFNDKEKAKQVSHALKDAIHAFYSVINEEPIRSEDGRVTDSVRTRIIKNGRVGFKGQDDDEFRGNVTGVMIYAPNFDMLQAREWFNYAIDYYMSGHMVEPETTLRLDVIDEENVNQGEHLESYREKSGLMEYELEDL